MLFWNFCNEMELNFAKYFNSDCEFINIITYNRIKSDFDGCILVTYANNCFYINFYVYERVGFKKINLYSGKALFDEQYNLCNSTIYNICEYER